MKYPTDLSYESTSRVILIGTTRCQHDPERLPPLPQVANNIADLRKLFSHPRVVGLPPDCLTILIDVEEAGAVVRSVARHALEATDTLIIYYAGHGLCGDNMCPLYLAVGTTTTDMKWASSIPITHLKKAMRDSSAHKRILILDCCYAGRGLGDDMSGGGDDVGDALDISGTYGIGAVPGDYKALAPPGERLTSFTRALVNVLNGGVATAGAVLTVDEVFSEVKRQVGRGSDMPLPQRNNSDDGGLFKIARNRALEAPWEDVLDDQVRRHSAGSTLPHLRPTGSSSGQPLSTTTWFIRRSGRRGKRVHVIGDVAVRVFLTDGQGKVTTSIDPDELGTRLVIELDSLRGLPVYVKVKVTCDALFFDGHESLEYQLASTLKMGTQIIESPVRVRSGSLSAVGSLTVSTSYMKNGPGKTSLIEFSFEVRKIS